MAETPNQRAERLRRERAAEEKRRTDERETRRAEADSRARSVESEARARQAEAESRAAEARARVEAEQARAAETRARVEAQTKEANDRRADEARKAADVERRAREAAPWNMAATAASVPLGISAGVVLSKTIDKRHKQTVAVRNAQLNTLGEGLAKTLAKVPDKGGLGKVMRARLTGAVRSADKLGLGKIKGPLGLTAAGLILAEAAFTRFYLAEKQDDERVKAALNGVATASLFAATNLVGERMIQNATPQALPKANALASIETARALIDPKGAKAAVVAQPSALAKVAPAVGRILARALPVAAVAAGIAVAGKAYLNSQAEKKAAGGPDAAPSGAGSAERTPGKPAETGSGRIWVPGYTKSDGVQVEGYYRERG